MISKEILNNLKDFGLNSYEIKLWVALLSRGISSASELSDISGVPRSRTYDVLESLERKGFIIQKLGKPIRYIAVPPNEVIKRVQKNIEEEAKQSIDIIEKFKESEIFEELNLLHSKSLEMLEPLDMSGILKDRKNMYNHLNFLINQAKDTVIILTNEEGLLRKMAIISNSLKKAKKRSVDIKIASNISKENIPKIIENYGFLDIRHSDKLKGRFFIIDNHIILPLTEGIEVHPDYDHGVWITTEHSASTLTNMFNHFWSSMIPLTKLR